jgi:hypothetical protein
MNKKRGEYLARFVGIALLIVIVVVIKNVWKPFAVEPFTKVPKNFVIDLDAPPEHRWLEIINAIPRKDIEYFAHNLHNVMQENTSPELREHLKKLLEKDLIPDEYRREIRGMQEGIQQKFGHIPDSLSYESLMFFNMAYMFTISCSAAIITDEEGTPYMLRNLDEPIDSPIKDFIRNMTINITWLKNGKKLFESTTWPFFVGALSGQRSREFAIALNARHYETDLPKDNIEYALNNDKVWSVASLVRHALQYAKDYHNACNIFEKTRISAPAYIIIAGKASYEGVIIARNREGIQLTDTLKDWLTYYPTPYTPTNPKNDTSPLIRDPKEARTPYIAISNIDSDYPESQDNEWACKGQRCKPLLIEKKDFSIGPRYRRNTFLNACHAVLRPFTVTDLFHVLWTPPVTNEKTCFSAVLCPAKNVYESYVIHPEFIRKS